MVAEAPPSEGSSIDAPGMPLFEPSHDADAKRLLDEQLKSLMWEGETSFSWVANESFWINFVSQAQLSPEASKQPLFKVKASHNGSVQLVNQTWLKSFVGAWERSHPHVVTVTVPGGSKKFHASKDFWSRVLQLKPTTDGTVKATSSLEPGLVISTTTEGWKDLVTQWEVDNKCTAEHRYEALLNREKEVVEQKASHKIEATVSPQPQAQSIASPTHTILTTACHKCDELASRVKSLEEILASAPSTASSPRFSPSLKSVSQQRSLPSPSQKSPLKRRVVALKNISVPKHETAVVKGQHGMVTGNGNNDMLVVRWDRREDGKTSRVSVEEKWVRTVNSGRLYEEASGPLLDLYEQYSTADVMPLKKFTSLLTSKGILTPAECHDVYLQLVGVTRNDGLTYDGFKYHALPRVSALTERRHLVATLLGIPMYCSASVRRGGAEGAKDGVPGEYEPYQSWLNQGITE